MPESLEKMKMPKHRGNMFVVVRKTYNESPVMYDSLKDVTPVGVFLSWEAAQDFRGACEQEFKEKGFDDKDYYFSVMLSTFYEG